MPSSSISEQCHMITNTSRQTLTLALTGGSLPGLLSTETTKLSLPAATQWVTLGVLGHGMDIAILPGIRKPGSKTESRRCKPGSRRLRPRMVERRRWRAGMPGNRRWKPGRPGSKRCKPGSRRLRPVRAGNNR